MCVFGNCGSSASFAAAVDAVRRRGKIRQHRRFRPLQAKHHGQRIGRVDAADRSEIDLPRRRYAGRRMDNALIACVHIGRGQSPPVVKQNVRAQFEGVGLAIGRHIPGLCQIADDLRVVGRIEFEQRRIMRRYRVQKREGGVAVAIVIAGLDRRREFQRAAAFWNGPRPAQLRNGKETSESSGGDGPQRPPVRNTPDNPCEPALYPGTFDSAADLFARPGLTVAGPVATIGTAEIMHPYLADSLQGCPSHDAVRQ